MLDSVHNPIESHVYGFGPLLLHGVVGDTRCAFVVGDDGSWWLRMPEFDECCADGGGFACVEEECPEFGFAC